MPDGNFRSLLVAIRSNSKTILAILGVLWTVVVGVVGFITAFIDFPRLYEAFNLVHLDRFNALERSGAGTGMPNGVVAVFDRADGCPNGWSEFAEGAGRFIVGVGGKYKLPYVSGEPEYQTGGAETHTLLIGEMPVHRHTVTSSPPGTDIHDGFGGSPNPYGLRSVYDPNVRETSNFAPTQHPNFMGATGGGQPHNNMPPYIALYFCKKS